MRPITPERVLSMRMRLAACFEPPRMLKSPDGPLLNFPAGALHVLRLCAETIASGEARPSEWADTLDRLDRLIDRDYRGADPAMVARVEAARVVHGRAH